MATPEDQHAVKQPTAYVPTQRSTYALAHVDDRTKPLGGIPDIVAHAIRREDGRERFAVIDPKLRQRSGAPVEELYKILGYLDNFGLRDNPSGAILYHTTRTDDLPAFLLAPTNGPDRLLALALNPARVGMSTGAVGAWRRSCSACWTSHRSPLTPPPGQTRR